MLLLFILLLLFFFNDTATTEIYTLSLHDALPILLDVRLDGVGHVGEPPAGPALLDGQLETLARDVEQLLDVRRHGADGHRERAVGVVPFNDTPEVQADDVPLRQAPMR